MIVKDGLEGRQLARFVFTVFPCVHSRRANYVELLQGYNESSDQMWGAAFLLIPRRRPS